jgi:hypothetical protein
MVFNATFNNISVKSCRSVLLEEETGENQQPAASPVAITQLLKNMGLSRS